MFALSLPDTSFAAVLSRGPSVLPRGIVLHGTAVPSAICHSFLKAYACFLLSNLNAEGSITL